ncbi:hypothetical protein CHS0354_007744 [Potamilus streckersoni]|uniref:Uncharacterized protein n=1 Tax=Potamilus streckersoni TaxID=2493646 RepID=A0AAE0VI51_9BIVA|nr:hypothetical protein CHS0354_007744 [Potamilus streckersoni]
METTKKALMMEKKATQKLRESFKAISVSQRKKMKDMDHQSSLLEEELESYKQGMSSLSKYFQTEEEEEDKLVVWYPFDRTNIELKPQPCWAGNLSHSPRNCTLFPCRKLNSYNFMFRMIPYCLQQPQMGSKLKNPMETKDKSERDNAESAGKQKKIFPDNMTEKERKLKITVENKRHENEKKNKPPDRAINYGKPMSVRAKQNPIRPVLRRMDIR